MYYAIYMYQSLSIKIIPSRSSRNLQDSSSLSPKMRLESL